MIIFTIESASHGTNERGMVVNNNNNKLTYINNSTTFSHFILRP